MANDVNLLSAVEQQSIAKALLVLINTEYSSLPVSKIEYQSLNTTKSSISLYSLPGSVVEKEFIDGSYNAIYRFSIVYRSIPTNSTQRINCEQSLNDLSEWLTTIDFSQYVSLSNNRQIEEIKLTNSAMLYKQYDNGTEDYHVIFSLRYKKEV